MLLNRPERRDVHRVTCLEDVVMINVKFGATVKKVLLAVIAVFALGSVAPVAAAPIAGTLGISGSVTVSATMIDWAPAGGGEGVTLVNEGTGYFADIFNPGVVPAFHADIIDLAGVLPVPNFLHSFEESPEVASEYDDLSFTLVDIIAPTAPACTGTETAVGTICSLGVFTLHQKTTGVDVSFDISGFFVDPTYGDDGSLNTAIGLYTTQVAGATIESITTTVSTGGSITATYSADFTATPVPEPATMLTFGLGTAVLAAHRRRRAKKNAQI
jgi:hypothetical protein